jgi:hypothetical protein
MSAHANRKEVVYLLQSIPSSSTSMACRPSGLTWLIQVLLFKACLWSYFWLCLDGRKRMYLKDCEMWRSAIQNGFVIVPRFLMLEEHFLYCGIRGIGFFKKCMGAIKIKCQSGGSLSEEKEVVLRRKAAMPFLLVPVPSSKQRRAGVGVLLKRGCGRDFLARWGQVQGVAEPEPVPLAEEEELVGERVAVLIAEPDERVWRTPTGGGAPRLLLVV